METERKKKIGKKLDKGLTERLHDKKKCERGEAKPPKEIDGMR